MKPFLILLVLTVPVALACPASACAQAEMRTSGGSPGALGFVYSGLPDFSGARPRWGDYPVVRHVYESSPAGAAGLRAGDVILKVNGRDGCEMEAYHGRTPGTRYTLVVQRGREQKEISFVLVQPSWPDSAWTPTFSPR